MRFFKTKKEKDCISITINVEAPVIQKHTNYEVHYSSFWHNEYLMYTWHQQSKVKVFKTKPDAEDFIKDLEAVYKFLDINLPEYYAPKIIPVEVY